MPGTAPPSQPGPGEAGPASPPAAGASAIRPGTSTVGEPPASAAAALRPLDPPMVPFALGGLGAWLVALLVVLPFRHDHESWFWICVAGFLWGIPGLLTMIRYDANRRRRRQTEFVIVDDPGRQDDDDRPRST